MKADLRCFSIVVFLLTLMGCGSAAKLEAEKETIAAIEELGGSVDQGDYISVNGEYRKDIIAAYLIRPPSTPMELTPGWSF